MLALACDDCQHSARKKPDRAGAGQRLCCVGSFQGLGAKIFSPGSPGPQLAGPLAGAGGQFARWLRAGGFATGLRNGLRRLAALGTGHWALGTGHGALSGKR
ncbi:hypothetical protein CPBF426_32090 [Xanthomonas arboricola pv. juglandis]|nr:hypothetical protein CPBF426_32090 [Xanthomonas arboricola pv. juglandis]